MTNVRRLLGLVMALGVVGVGCATEVPTESKTQAVVGNSVKSQLRGYDLGPPFPAGLRDSGLVNGYAEGEWVPFVAVIEGKKLAESDSLAGDAGDGRFGVNLIVPTFSPRHNANGISELATTGTYGQGSLTPIPNPFDNRWLVDNGYNPFVLGAYSSTGAVDSAPTMGAAAQRTGPTRFGGDVSSVSVPIEFSLPADSERVELLVSVRLAPPSLRPITPDDQGFPGTEAGDALGAGSFFPGPGPIFVGYEVGKPTGIATVPIRVDKHSCESDEECVPGQYCVGAPNGTCYEPCVDDSNCPSDEICEDGRCTEPPPPCVEEQDCEGGYSCVGGSCLPECPNECDDQEFCDPDPCVPPEGSPPCVYDEQCEPGSVCEDGTCQTPPSPCDVSCPSGTNCQAGQCIPPDVPCEGDSDCPGGDVCHQGVCVPGIPPCIDDYGNNCNNKPCEYDAECPGGDVCFEGQCVTGGEPVPCESDSECPSGQECDGSFCDVPEPCSGGGTCPTGELCEGGGGGLCIPEHPPIDCNNDNDCPSGDVCQGGYCEGPGEPCHNDNQCQGDDVCNKRVCTPPPTPCSGDYECGGGLCEGGVCIPPHDSIPCTTASECPSGDECVAGYCEPPQGCTGDRQCPGGELCESGTCRPGQPPVGCEVNSDCPPPDYPDDVYPPVCFSGFCTTNGGDCSADSDCAGGFTCEEGVCIPATDPVPCSTIYDCSGGQLCVGGVCRPGNDVDECTVDSDCRAYSGDDVNFLTCIGGVCTTPGNTPSTTPCDSVADCAPGYTCGDGVCVEEPGACQLDGDCPAGTSCVSGWCGTPCETAEQCGPEDVCAQGRCSKQCYDSSECDAYEACMEGGCIPQPYIVQAGHPGDQSKWEVDVPGEGGCACNTGGSGGPGGLIVLLAVVLGLARRRSRR